MKKLFEKLGLSNSKEKEKKSGKVIKDYAKKSKEIFTEKLSGIEFDSIAKDDTLKGCFFSKKEKE